MDYSFDPGPVCGDGPVVFGVPWACPAQLIRAAARFARSVDAHLVCAFVDPAELLRIQERPVLIFPAG